MTNNPEATDYPEAVWYTPSDNSSRKYIRDDLCKAALASSAPATGELERELERGLTRIARSNLLHYLNAAQFKCEADRTAALNCLDVLEEEIDGLSDLVAVLRSYHAAEDRLAALSSAPASGEREQIVAWLLDSRRTAYWPTLTRVDIAEAIRRGDHRTQSGEMEGGEHG